MPEKIGELHLLERDVNELDSPHLLPRYLIREYYDHWWVYSARDATGTKRKGSLILSAFAGITKIL